MNRDLRLSIVDCRLARSGRAPMRYRQPKSHLRGRGTDLSQYITKLPHNQITNSNRAFSLIEMMIAIVILGLGLVMTATMFPVAWTRARTLTEYTTQRVVSQSAAATIAETIRPSGSTFTSYVAAGKQTGKYFISSGGLAGDLFFDPVLYADPDSSLRLPCNGPAQCYSHLSVLIPSDTRVHALNMENMPIAGPSTSPGENPYLIEKMFDLCQGTPKVCRTDYPIPDIPMSCDSPLDGGAEFCARSFYSPQVGLGARMYPPMDNPPTDQGAYNAWLEKFNSHRYAWSALHRLRNAVGPPFVPAPPNPLPAAESTRLASQAAQAVGTTRTFDFYIVTLKRPQATSRFAVQNPDQPLLPDWYVTTPASIAALPLERDVALPVAWRVQLEIPGNLKSAVGVTNTPGNTPPATDDDPTGIPTEVQVPPSGLSEPSASLVLGMFPVGAQFVDEINGQIFRVVRRRLNAAGTLAFLTLDRELLLQDFDNSPEFGGNGALDPQDLRRTVWVYPPPIAERNGTTVVFDDKSPVVGIDVRSISMTPPG